jgi:hypothetical protein
MFHYCTLSQLVGPLQGKAQEMVKHLASLAEKRLIISFAPKTLAYLVLKVRHFYNASVLQLFCA